MNTIERHPASFESERAFTLIELMTVVAMVAILAVIAVVSYRKFILSAKSSEATYMVGAIRGAEESYRAETLTYLNVSSSASLPNANWYPRLGTQPNSQKVAWPGPGTAFGNADKARWDQLGARPDAPVVYGYAVNAGAAGAVPPAPGTTQAFTWPTTTEPWYVIVAKGDVDGNGIFSYVVSSSFNGEVYVENEGQ